MAISSPTTTTGLLPLHQHHNPTKPTTLSFPKFKSNTYQFAQTLPNPDPPPKIQSLPLKDLTFESIGHLLRLAVRNWDLRLVRAVHGAVLKIPEESAGFGFDPKERTFVFNRILSMYVKLRRVSDARKVFEEMLLPDVVSYTSLISAYAKSGQEKEALSLFIEMRDCRIEPNEFTFVAVLTSCIRHLNYRFGSAMHGLAVKMGYCFDLHVANALMGLYVKVRGADDVVQLFGSMLERDVSSWNAVILSMVEEYRYDEAFKLFHEMKMDGFCGDQFTLSNLLTALHDGPYRAQGEAMHAHGIKVGLEFKLSFCNALIAFYTKFGFVEDIVSIFDGMPNRDLISSSTMISGLMEFGKVEPALKVFNQMTEINSVSYNALMSGFCQNREGLQAIELFVKIVEDGMELSDFTVASVLHSCALVAEVEISKQVHGFVLKVGCVLNAWMEAALLDMYVKCNRMEEAEKLIRKCTNKDSYLISSTSMICGYARNGFLIEALSFFNATVSQDDMLPIDEVAVTTMLGVCGALGFMGMGQQIHCYALKICNPFDVAIGNALFSMYSKSGNMDGAMKVFNSMSVHDVVSWNALLTAHLLHRHGDEALDVWKKMNSISIKPDHISFLLVLSACKYTTYDSVITCRNLFSSMASSYGVKASEEHYASLVEVLGHWNYFDEAEEFIRHMPCEPGVLVWRALLDSSRSHANFNMETQAMQRIFELDPTDPSSYVLVSNLYSSSGRWHVSEKIREEMRKKGIRKHPSRSWVIDKNLIHSFYTRDRSHSQSKDIYSALDILIVECMKVGYAPDTSFVLHEVEEYQKKDFLFYHSAKLASTYGLLTTTPGRPVRVMKNVHICGDCHSFLNFVSITTAREIILRDSSGFHHFKGGKCSCRDV